MTRLTFAAVLLATSGIALAQPTGSQPGTPAPAKPVKVEPKKDGTKEAPKAGTLKVGDKAPDLKVSDWVKGDRVSSFESGKAYVVEFWATWCPPCKKSIPHLTELAKEHKGLTIVGVSVWEDNRKKADKAALLKGVQDFVTGQGDKMAYTVAYDGEKFMEKNWMAAAGRSGIPTAFVIGGDGKIAWIGNPLAPEFNGAIDTALKSAKSSATPLGKPTTSSTPGAGTPGQQSKPHG